MKKSQEVRTRWGLRVVSERPARLPDPPRVFLPLHEAKKLWGFVRGVHGEINGLGLVEAKRIGRDFLIKEIFILPQSASDGHAEINGPAFNRYVATCEDPGKIRFQWHSHGKIGVFFSGRDLETISRWPAEYLISLVVNKAGKYECRLDIFEPVYLCLAVELYIVVPIEAEIMSLCEDGIKRNVRETWPDKLERFLSGQSEELPAAERGMLKLPLSAFSFPGEEATDD